ncbi:MAG: short-chain fatty acid transporter [Clostridiales bacterium]|nr:MAG: short-chain fatty acid transporter [Clostridiales bacterium]
MFKRFTKGCVSMVERYLPDPFLFATILTIIVFISGIIFTGQSAIAMIGHWSDGFWKLLAFSMQMALVLVTGHVLAKAPIIERGIRAIASIPKSKKGAVGLVSVVSIVACWINWGFGLVIGTLIAKEVAKKVKDVDYRLLIATGYAGFLVWHAGFSGSIPLKVASATEDLAKMTKGALTAPVPTSETIFAPMTLIPMAIILILMPLISIAMTPSKEDTISIDPSLLEDTKQPKPDKSTMTPADRMENSSVISMIIGAMGLVYIVNYFANNGFKLNLNIVNFTFLFLGIILHYTPRNFLNAVKVAIKGTAGILIQFPFYAGIMGMMVGAGEGTTSLAAQMSNFFVGISNKTTFPLFSFISAGVVNIFVPSGGGQWAVQGPIMMPAGQLLGVPAAKTAMSIAWGDAWTNLIQPFWALPALGIAGLNAKDIMGFCLVNLIVFGFVIGLCLMFIPV